MKINSFTLINAYFAHREISDFAQLKYPESSLRFFFFIRTAFLSIRNVIIFGFSLIFFLKKSQ